MAGLLFFQKAKLLFIPVGITGALFGLAFLSSHVDFPDFLNQMIYVLFTVLNYPVFGGGLAVFLLIILFVLNFGALFFHSDRTKRIASAIVFGIIFVMTGISVYALSDMPVKVGVDYRACCRKMNDIAAALDCYKTGNSKLPENLRNLEGGYIKEIPRCVRTFGKDNQKTRKYFSRRYGLNMGDYEYETDRDRQNFTLYCKGKNHMEGYSSPKLENYPVYSSLENGIIEAKGAGF